MRRIRYDQQALEDTAGSIARLETQLDSSLSALHALLDRLESMPDVKQSSVLSDAIDSLYAHRQRLGERLDEAIRLRQGLRKVIDIFEETEREAARGFAGAYETRLAGYEADNAPMFFASKTPESVLQMLKSLSATKTVAPNATDAAERGWRAVDFDESGIAALAGVRRVSVASIAPRVDTVYSSADVIAPAWMRE